MKILDNIDEVDTLDKLQLNMKAFINPIVLKRIQILKAKQLGFTLVTISKEELYSHCA